ncbi:MAG TPA: DUF3455 domain-containing protein [Polyangia bacterium]|nr:DUF3455 domain-containing protein [Polyangia bacterium]
MLLVLLLGLGCAPRVTPPVVADPLKPPAGQAVLFRAHAQGAQIYECNGREWVLKAPDAELRGEHGEPIGKHYAGPTWEGADGSKVVGELRQRAPAPAPDAVPWLLLQAKSTAGAGRFGRVTYIQRVDTTGGKAPASGCDGEHAGAAARVGYTATYYFYGGERQQ